MDCQEAIETLRFEGGIEITGNSRRVAEFFEGVDVAISALQELQEYKKIGTVKGYKDAIKAYDDCYFEKQELEKELSDYKELGNFTEVKKAVDKQNMKMPDNLENVTDFTGELLFKTGNCPECGFEDIYSHRTQYCPKCGQKILWKEADKYDS